MPIQYLGDILNGLVMQPLFCPQLFDALRLAFQRDDREMVAIKEGEHVAMNIEDEHAAGILECREG